jgi:hypothetical protein
MNLYLGFEFAPIDGWEIVVPVPKPPSNYKDEAKKAAYVAKKIEELRDGKAAVDPLCGSVGRAAVFGTASKAGTIKPLFVSDGEPHPGAALLEFLHRHAGDRFKTGNLTLFGHKIHRAMRLCAIEHMALGAPLHLSQQWAVELDGDFRYNRFPGYIDPVSVIYGTSDTDLAGAARRLGEDVPEKRAEDMAELAFRLSKHLGF